ncbi:MAG: Phage integrase family protein [Firmicutes bacterium ADurb.Bin262]|nr:MAG: Phage integrase family protein [Firmicutes bacterium ADurb.Bin262]
MGLEVRYGRGGELRKNWYGSYVDSTGKRRVVSLAEQLPTRHFPGSLRETGDTVFEASRARAQKELEDHQTEERQKGRADHLTERLIASKTGRPIEYVRLADLPAAWRGLGRESKPGAAWLQWCDTIFARFAEAVPCEYLHEVTAGQASAYVETLRRAFTRRTANGAAHILKSAFKRFLPPGAANPFEGGIHRKGPDSDGGTVHRRPFTAGELARLFEAARADPVMFPLVVCAACTGMRRGDVCGLRWQSVDLRAGVLSVKTSKTGASVQIPIFQTLREVLETALADREPDAVHVWPDAARMYETNPDGLTWRFKKIAAAVIHDPESIQDAPQGAQGAPGIVPLAKTLPEVLNAVQAKLDGIRRDRVTETLNLYAQGASVREIEKRTGRARSTVSADLHLAEDLSGLRFMAKQAQGGIKDKVARLTRLDAAGRARRASVADWHSLRTSWITLALAAGVPVELCRLVTGHQTVEIVMRHYFKPQAEHLRAVLGDKLPDVLTGNGNGASPKQIGAGGTVEGLARQLKDLSPADRARLAKLLKGVEK